MEENEKENVVADEQSNVEEEKNEEQDALTTVNKAWEERENAMREDYEKRIAERDALIAQLIKGKNDPPPTDGIIEKVNSRRQYKKW